MEDFKPEDEIIQLGCNLAHIFHGSCIGEWVKNNNSCPLCRNVIVPENM